MLAGERVGRCGLLRGGWRGHIPPGSRALDVWALLESVAFRNEVSIGETPKASQIMGQRVAGGKEKNVVAGTGPAWQCLATQMAGCDLWLGELCSPLSCFFSISGMLLWWEV